MSRQRESLLLVSVLLLLGAVAGGAWLLLTPGDEPQVVRIVRGPSAAVGPETPQPEEDEPTRLAPVASASSGPGGGQEDETTVIHPLRVELSLVERALFADAGVESIGSGATAGLRGSVVGLRGEPVPASVTFTAGANAGRLLTSDSRGQFGASNLYPGLSIVTVDVPGVGSAERELSLVSRRTQDLNLDFSRPAALFGVVTDMVGEPLADVRVRIDGKEVLTDDLGEFAVRRVTPGAVLCVLGKEGLAHYREVVGVAAGSTVTKDRLQFRLAPGCSLEVRVEGAAGGPGPAQLFLLPGGAERVNTRVGQRTFPWYVVSPVEVWPGGSVKLSGLQEGRLNLMVYRPGAVAEQSGVVAKLVASRDNQASLGLLPSRPLSGFVRRNGEPVQGATVVLEAPNRTSATVAALRRPSSTLQAMVLPHLPAARQEVETDARGLFRFTSYAGAERYYLTATRGEEWRGSMVVEPDAEGIELELERVEEPAGSLRLELAGRFQGLPVQVLVDGAPQETFVLEAVDDLVLEGLETGTWRLDVRWNRDELVRAATLKLDPDARLELGLPEGAILGQTAEERRRAGM